MQTSAAKKGHATDAGSGTASVRDSGQRRAAEPSLENQSLQSLLANGSIRAELTVGASDDPMERQADNMAERVIRGKSACDCGKPNCGGCSNAGNSNIHRKPAAKTSARKPNANDHHAPDHVTGRLGSGSPLGDKQRSRFEPAFGADLSSVRVHTGPAANDSATEINARAFTAGNNIAFADGQYQPSTDSGERLLAHELSHTIQQNSTIAPAPSVQKQETEPSAADSAAAAADETAVAAGPCAVVVGSLSNQGLLTQLNRSRLYLNDTTRGEDEWYDYGNLYRRLSLERRHRILAGQVWLNEGGLISPPETLYRLIATGPLALSVARIDGSAVAGALAFGEGVVMSHRQFQNFLEFNGILEVDARSYFEDMEPGSEETATVNLPEDSRYATTFAQQPDFRQPIALGIGAPGADPMFQFDPFAQLNAQLFPQPVYFPNGLDSVPNPFTPDQGQERVPNMRGAQDALDTARELPGLVGSPGSERLFRPRNPRSEPTVLTIPITGQPGENFGQGPNSLGALGFLGRGGWGLPDGTTGFMWEGHHVTDLAFSNGRLSARGYRAPFRTHAMSSIERGVVPGGGPATAQLNVDAPGGYRNDAGYPYGGSLWGQFGRHWNSGAIAIVTTNGQPADAHALMQVMADATGNYQNDTYRYSPPPEGSEAHSRASQRAERTGNPNWCGLGARMCVNLPIDIHQQAANGLPLTFTNAAGELIDLSNPHHATAANMSEFMNSLPEDVLEAHNLRRVDLGRAARIQMGLTVGSSLIMSIGSNMYRDANGEEVSLGDYATDAGIDTTAGVVSLVAEDMAYNSMSNALINRGVSSGTAGVVSRLGASTGIAVIIAPVTTGAEMYFSDEHFTDIDYYARMGRSTVGAGSSALVTAGTFALIGSAVGPIGTGAGFLIGLPVGFVSYLVADEAYGDEVEQGIRDFMGEGGCTDGIGPDH